MIYIETMKITMGEYLKINRLKKPKPKIKLIHGSKDLDTKLFLDFAVKTC